MNKIKNVTNITPIMLIFFLCPLFKGMHDTLSVVIISVIMLIAIILKYRKAKTFYYSFSSSFIIISVWAISYLIASIYAIDKGMAFLGFLKMLSIPIFLLLYLQYDYSSIEKKNVLYKTISYSGAVMVPTSFLLSLIPNFQEYFFKSNRLQGFFNYANSFGIWLLIGLIVMLFQENSSKKDYVAIALLVIGIILTNSRAIIVLAVLACITCFFFTKLNKKKYAFILGGVLGIGISTLFLLSLVNINSRVANITSASEFTTRLLYYCDGIQQIIKHPFGLGHLGWWTIQSGIQTGVYDCQYVHNSLLQICLDVGIIPCLLLMFLAIKILFSKDVSAMEKVILVFIALHSLIDFDFEFLIIIYLIAIMPHYKLEKLKKFSPYVILVALLLFMTYFTLPLLCYECKDYKSAYKLYPNYTFAIRRQMHKTTDDKLKQELVNRAYKLNQTSYDIYQELFEIANKNKDTETAYAYIRKVTEQNKYSMLAYSKYLNFLETTMYEYDEAQNPEMTKLYMERIIEVEDLIKNALESTNPLVYKTAHVPLLDIPEELQEFIDEVKVYYEETYTN